MVSSRKRGRQEMEAVELPREPSLLERLRNMWEFANLAQWIFIFGRAVKIDENLDIEELEMECLRSHSTVIPEIGLALLKFVSSHRGLTPELFEEYTRRQYLAKAPQRNPFGDGEEPTKFNDLDIFKRIRILQQLTQWTMINPDRIRERMEEQKDTEQTFWRIEPFGWDDEDRTYYVLDDNRLYRQTEPPPPPPPAAKPKKNSKKAKAALRASKRRKTSEAQESEAEPVEDEDVAERVQEDDGFGGVRWECLAVTLEEVNEFVASIQKTRNPNEKILRNRLIDDLLPLLEKQEEARKRKAAQKERELLNLEKLATAKRSSRIAGKLEHQKQEEEAREAQRKKETELAMAKKEQEKWLRLEKERESRMMTREQRVKEREARRILHEEELANLSEDSKKIETGQGRLSERHLKAEIERKKQALEELAEEEDWIFDCICGAYGQIDDGTHSIACEKCNIWQHSKCVGVSKAEADSEDFHFVCKTCERRARDDERAKNHPPIKIKLNRPGSSSAMSKQNGSSPAPLTTTSPNAQASPQKSSYAPREIQAAPAHSNWTNAQQTSPWHHSFPPPKSSILIQGPSVMQTPTSYSNGVQFSPPKPAGASSTASNTLFSPKTDHPRPSSGSAFGGQQQVPYTNGGSPFPGQKSGDIPSPAQNAIFNPQIGLPGPSSGVTLGSQQRHPLANGSPSLSPQNTMTASSANAFSPPRHLSPTSLPAPKLLLGYNTAVGYKPYNNHNSVNGLTGASQSAKTPYPQQSEGNDTSHRRSSISLPSPLGETPVLKPYNRPDQSLSFSTGSSPHLASTPFTPLQPSSSPLIHAPPLPQPQHPSHASALPPSASGISPTKQSSPMPSVCNGSFGSATPSILPPVASLSPSPRLQNLTPPVKPSDPEPYRQSSQTFGQ